MTWSDTDMRRSDSNMGRSDANMRRSDANMRRSGAHMRRSDADPTRPDDFVEVANLININKYAIDAPGQLATGRRGFNHPR